MILNLKKLNEHIAKQYFKMDTLVSAITMVHRGCCFLSLDFTDAYYSVRVAPESRKYLRFCFEGKLYEFTCLPNGLRPAPRLFTKLLKIPLAVLRKEYGINITAYLDDTLLVFDSQQEALKYGAIAAKLFQDLGFVINIKKSVLRPAKQVEFLGVVIDSEKMTITLPKEKAEKIKDEVKSLLQAETCTIRSLASVLGKLQATASANSFAALHTKEIEKIKNVELKEQGGWFDSVMTVSSEIRMELKWWLQNVKELSAPIITEEPGYVVFTDACLKGWGFFDPQTKVSGGGRWSEVEAQKHINVLELMAVELTLQSICKNMYNTHIRIMSDNTTTVACIKKQGSIHSSSCNEVAQRIWRFMLKRGNWLTVAHCPGVENVEADKASREFKEDIEWSLKQEIFDKICKHFDMKIEIDLFASRLNNKVERYSAWHPDPGAEFVDAFSENWGGGKKVYVFPPFGILPRVLQKFKRDNAEGLVVIPFWTTKAWFTMWAHMLVQRPILIKNVNKILFLPYRDADVRHPMRGLQLMVGNLSSRSYKREDFLLEQQRLWDWPEGGQPADYMGHIGADGYSFVTGGVRVRPIVM